MKRQLPDPTDPNAGDGSKKNLSLEGTLTQKMRGIPVKTGPAAGYDPYDTVTVNMSKERGKDKQGKKPADLRKLSESILLARACGELKKK